MLIDGITEILKNHNQLTSDVSIVKKFGIHSLVVETIIFTILFANLKKIYILSENERFSAI